MRFEKGQYWAVWGRNVSGEMCRATDGMEDRDTWPASGKDA